MIKISDWYADFAEVSFPSVFIRLNDEEKKAICENIEGTVKKRVWQRMKEAIHAIPGAVVLNADCCAPTDSEAFKKRRILHTPISSWKQLTTSEKVCKALANGESDRLCYRPYRRMDQAREFRLFVKEGKLVGASQYNPALGFLSKVQRRREEIWTLMQNFFEERISPYLAYNDVTIDVYLCSDSHFLIIDFNEWGGETKPLMMRNWELKGLEFSDHPLVLVKKAVEANGNVEVNF